MTDSINHPSHYTWLRELAGIEVIDITRHMNFNLGCVIKYVLRAGRKAYDGASEREAAIRDLKKARWYIDDEIKRIAHSSPPADEQMARILNNIMNERGEGNERGDED